MKDFKQTPKMNASGSHYCGGGKVKKYAEGGEIISKVHEAIRSGKDLDPGIIREPTKPYVDRDPGIGRDLKGTLNIPGIGEVKQAPPKLTPNGRGMLLKTGGKVKRGNKK